MMYCVCIDQKNFCMDRGTQWTSENHLIDFRSVRNGRDSDFRSSIERVTLMVNQFVPLSNNETATISLVQLILHRFAETWNSNLANFSPTTMDLGTELSGRRCKWYVSLLLVQSLEVHRMAWPCMYMLASSSTAEPGFGFGKLHCKGYSCHNEDDDNLHGMAFQKYCLLALKLSSNLSFQGISDTCDSIPEDDPAL